MHITGIIAEYNPLHAGHEFHISQTKALTGADYVITVLSGDFVQRGLPALLDKHTRAKMALEAGSDLVLELPTAYALSSGEGFGFGGISLLDKLGCVNTVSFGTEIGDLKNIITIADLLSNESDEYKQTYQTALKQGLTHPSARATALKATYPNLDTTLLDGASNNMLALEYCKALSLLESKIQPVTVKRIGQTYLAQDVSAFSNSVSCESSTTTTFASATAIRNTLQKVSEQAILNADMDFVSLKRVLSPNVFSILEEALASHRLLFSDDFSNILHYKLLTLDFDSLLTYREVTEAFANKIIKHRHTFTSFTQFANLLWTKETTYAKVCRTLMYILLDFKKTSWDVHTPVPYARILGFKKEAVPLLSELKKYTSIPLLSKLADAEKVLSPTAMNLLDLDINAAHIYDSVAFQKCNQHANGSFDVKPPIHEMQKQIIIL